MNNQRRLWPRASLAALTGLNLLDYFDRQLLASVLTPLKDEMGFTDGQLGSLQSAFMLGYFLTAPIFGYLGDRCPRRWLVAAGVFVWSLGTLLSGHANVLGSLIFRVLVGLGEASFGTISPGWIADLFVPQKRNMAISIFYLAIPVGSALGYIVGSTIAAHYGWRAAFLWAGYPGIAVAFLLFLLREPPRGASETIVPLSSKVGWRSYLTLIGLRDYRLVVAGYAAQTFALGGFALWAPTFLHRVHHMDFAAAGQFFGGSLVVTGLLATLVGGVAGTMWRKRSPAGYAWVLALSAAAAVPTAFAAFLIEDASLARVALVASMFFLFLPTGPVNTLILETVPVAQRATAMAASIFAIHFFGDLWSPKIVGMISDHYGSLRQGVMLLPVALIGSAFFWSWLTVVQRRPSPAATVP